MNIYDEAIKELDNAWDTNGLNYNFITRKALERAKKVEEMNIEQEEYIQALLFDRLYTQEKCVKKIAKIKKELEKMK